MSLRRLALIAAIALASAPALAEDISVTPAGSGSGGSGVTSIATGCQATGGTITTTGTISTSETPTTLSAANAPILASYCGGAEKFTQATNDAPTIAQAGSAGFPSGWFTELCNTVSNTKTLTPSGGTVGGAATFVFPAGTAAAPQCVKLISDGVSDYIVISYITTTAVTQSAGDNTTKLATDAFVTTAVANAIAGVNPAISVNAATTAASDTSGCAYANGVAGVGATLTCEVNTVKVIDGFTFNSITQSLLVKNDTQSPSGAFNGIYNLTALHTAGTGDIYTRRLDYDTSSDINNTGAIPVISGTANGTTSWLLTTLVTTVGTDALSYTKFSINPATLAAVATSGSASDLGTGTLPNARIVALPGANLIAGFNHPGYKSTYWYAPLAGGGVAGGAEVASTVYCHPWPIGAQGFTAKTLAVNVTTADNTGHVSMALYNNDGTAFRPGTKIDDITSTGISLSGTGVQSKALAGTTDALTGGYIWGCASTDSTTVRFSTVPTAGSTAGIDHLLGSATFASITGTTIASGVSCTAGTSCNGASFVWSGTTFAWPSTLVGTSFTDVTGTTSIMVYLQVN